jgi:hypothetical protein
MIIAAIVLGGHYAAQLWFWIQSNVMASLTFVLVLVTAYYARATTQYVKIASEQFAAQIEPVPVITLGSGSWKGNTFLGRLTITATRNELVLVGGDILLRCEHGNIRLAKQLGEWIGHTMGPGQPFVLDLKVPFDHAGDGSHNHGPSFEGFLIYKDSRNVQSYRLVIESAGIRRIYRQRDLERLKTWMSYQSALAAARFSLWAMNVQIAMQKILLQRGKPARGRKPDGDAQG